MQFKVINNILKSNNYVLTFNVSPHTSLNLTILNLKFLELTL